MESNTVVFTHTLVEVILTVSGTLLAKYGISHDNAALLMAGVVGPLVGLAVAFWHKKVLRDTPTA